MILLPHERHTKDGIKFFALVCHGARGFSFSPEALHGDRLTTSLASAFLGGNFFPTPAAADRSNDLLYRLNNSERNVSSRSLLTETRGVCGGARSQPRAWLNHPLWALSRCLAKPDVRRSITVLSDEVEEKHGRERPGFKSPLFCAHVATPRPRRTSAE